MNPETLYLLGFLSALAFGFRFIIQWLVSESAGKSIVPLSFWQLSLFGNVALMLHGLIQLQYPVAAIQAINGVISWRNMNLMSLRPVSFKTVFIMMLFSLTLITAYFCFGSTWFRVPTHIFQTDPEKTVPISLHILGSIGIFLFNIRFLIQWWQAEQSKAPVLSVTFWWLSVIGGILSLVYFAALQDMVNLIGPLLGMVPYIRNLMLLKKNEAA